jgi:hypothetical protein
MYVDMHKFVIDKKQKNYKKTMQNNLLFWKNIVLGLYPYSFNYCFQQQLSKPITDEKRLINSFLKLLNNTMREREIKKFKIIFWQILFTELEINNIEIKKSINQIENLLLNDNSYKCFDKYNNILSNSSFFNNPMKEIVENIGFWHDYFHNNLNNLFQFKIINFILIKYLKLKQFKEINEKIWPMIIFNTSLVLNDPDYFISIENNINVTSEEILDFVLNLNNKEYTIEQICLLYQAMYFLDRNHLLQYLVLCNQCKLNVKNLILKELNIILKNQSVSKNEILKIQIMMYLGNFFNI